VRVWPSGFRSRIFHPLLSYLGLRIIVDLVSHKGISLVIFLAGFYSRLASDEITTYEYKMLPLQSVQLS
jgi:hypothetical protein